MLYKFRSWCGWERVKLIPQPSIIGKPKQI